MITLTKNFQTFVIPLITKFSKKYGSNNIHVYFFEIFEITKTSFKENCIKDKDQSWRNESGAMLENLVVYFIQEQVQQLGYDLVTDEQIKSASPGDEIMSIVYRNIVVRYGNYSIVPDGDIVIYNPKNGAVLAIISCKNSLRERYAQTLYWKIKLSLDPITKPIKMYFITMDKEKGKKPELDIHKNGQPTKSRILLEYEMDGVYVGRDLLSESEKVKEFDKFIEDLKLLLK